MRSMNSGALGRCSFASRPDRRQRASGREEECATQVSRRVIGVPGCARSPARAGGRLAAQDGGGCGCEAGVAAGRAGAARLRLSAGWADGPPIDVRLSELFGPGKDALVVYNFMFPRDADDDSPGPASGQTALLPLAEGPCPSCTALLDQLDGAAAHVGQHLNLAVVAKAPLSRVVTFVNERGWRHLRVLSSANNSYNRDYRGETADGIQRPMLNVFHRDRDGSATSGARSCSTRRATTGRSHGTLAPSSPCGTSSTSPPKGDRTGTSSSATHETPCCSPRRAGHGVQPVDLLSSPHGPTTGCGCPPASRAVSKTS